MGSTVPFALLAPFLRRLKRCLKRRLHCVEQRAHLVARAPEWPHLCYLGDPHLGDPLDKEGRRVTKGTGGLFFCGLFINQPLGASLGLSGPRAAVRKLTAHGALFLFFLGGHAGPMGALYARAYAAARTRKSRETRETRETRGVV